QGQRAGVGCNQLIGDGVTFAIGRTGRGNRLVEHETNIGIQRRVGRIVIGNRVAVRVVARNRGRIGERRASVQIGLADRMLGQADQVIAGGQAGRLRWRARSDGDIVVDNLHVGERDVAGIGGNQLVADGVTFAIRRTGRGDLLDQTNPRVLRDRRGHRVVFVGRLIAAGRGRVDDLAGV